MIKYKPFLSLSDVIKKGFGDLVESDGEERGENNSFIPVEDLPDLSTKTLEFFDEPLEQIAVDTLTATVKSDFTWVPWSHDKRLTFLKKVEIK